MIRDRRELVSAPTDVQQRVFVELVRSNPDVVRVIERVDRLGVPDVWVTAGALFQTVWNGLTGRDPRAGIRDLDVNYCDCGDLSWEAEDAVITRGHELFADVGVEVEIRNEARVHLWYEQRFGVPAPPLRSTCAAVETFPCTSSAFAVRPRADGSWQVHAPFGFGDLFAMVARPNPVLAPAWVYERKTARWAQEWPELQVVPWPDDARAVDRVGGARGGPGGGGQRPRR